ncbi:hypothetical protein [Blastococcus sp. TF02A-30]|uniref:hypothetical protein n=1 Tax=Blastococcus sp. TF02A-30 TaxID=2250580 RepID=UPI000DE935AD|nr:hypothetical protein [Blastococcus sp. TF02A-30]RBY85595.1 hypothetical protein DQ241_14895 [Blastococcus sp. TF02A-30]
MILVAFLLVLAGLGLFVAGVLTGVTALYWACVATCVVAAVVIFLARRKLADAPPSRTGDDARRPVGATASDATAGGATASGATAGGAASPHAAPEAPAQERAAAAQPPAEPAPPDGRAPVEPAHAAAPAAGVPVGPDGEPPLEEVEVTDLLLVVDLTDEVLVIDEHPRYHLEGCPHLAGATPIPLPLDEARADGFTPCGTCRPDRHLADRARSRRSAGN